LVFVVFPMSSSFPTQRLETDTIWWSVY
jgi:hypothetical protein